MSKLITLDYQGLAVTASRDAWFNATEIAAMFGKRVNDWLNLKETQDYINRLNARSNTSENGIWIKTKRGRHNGGTWLHPDLMVCFARLFEMAAPIRTGCQAALGRLKQNPQQTIDNHSKTNAAATSAR